MNEFATMKDIGAKYGLTSHQIGKLLKHNKLRTSEGRPSLLAFELGLVEQKFDEFGHYLWSWHVAKTELILGKLGHNATDTLVE